MVQYGQSCRPIWEIRWYGWVLEGNHWWELRWPLNGCQETYWESIQKSHLWAIICMENCPARIRICFFKAAIIFFELAPSFILLLLDRFVHCDGVGTGTEPGIGAGSPSSSKPRGPLILNYFIIIINSRGQLVLPLISKSCRLSQSY